MYIWSLLGSSFSGQMRRRAFRGWFGGILQWHWRMLRATDRNSYLLVLWSLPIVQIHSRQKWFAYAVPPWIQRRIWDLEIRQRGEVWYLGGTVRVGVRNAVGCSKHSWIGRTRQEAEIQSKSATSTSVLQATTGVSAAFNNILFFGLKFNYGMSREAPNDQVLEKYMQVEYGGGGTGGSASSP